MTTPGSGLLLATDLAPRCDRATDRAIALARGLGGRAVAATVVEPSERTARNVPRHDLPGWYTEPGDAQLARQRLEPEFAAAARAWEVQVREGAAGEQLARLLDAIAPALVVTGPVQATARPPVVLGSTLDRLLRRPGIALLMVHERVHGAYRRLLLASDFSAPCAAALQRARTQFPDAKFTVLHGYSVPMLGLLDSSRDQAIADAASRLREEGRAFLREAGVDDGVELLVEHGDPARLVQQYVDSVGADLVVLGTNGRGGIHELLVGSVARRMLTTVRADMLVVRA
jgi:nucleotide-binding universal stress UspA family protein